MNELTHFLDCVASYKPCCFNQIVTTVGMALMTSIVKELLRLGYEEYESVYFDERKRRLRGMRDTVGVCFYYSKKSLDNINLVKVNGLTYGLLMDFVDADGLCNRSLLQLGHICDLEKIYNYLRLERKSNSLKKN